MRLNNRILMTNSISRLIPFAVAATFALGVMAVALHTANGTPIYAGRSGRTCDNCHVTPNKWVNPKLADRKCTLSCQGCHVDPAGGGMRTVSGRFFGRSTMPMIATSPRPTADWDRNAPYVGRRDKATSYNDNLPYGPSTIEEIPDFREEVSDGWAWGQPLGSESRWGFWDGRYHSLAADPMLRVGVDLRAAVLAPLAFPMQVDVPVVFHPIHHLTFLVNTGARGRSSGFGDSFSNDHSPYFREAFVMLHEAPFQSYVKAGRFVPSFGLRLDDHTSSIRRQFELDGSQPESRVTGVELGANPNYPFFQWSYFRMTSRTRPPDQWDIFNYDEGWGMAANVGYRHEGWTVGASALSRRRPLEEGGDTQTVGAYAVLNPWYWFKNFPVTYQVEYDYGEFLRRSGFQTNHSALYQEVDYLWRNGVVFLLAHDWFDPDREVVDDEAHRFQLGTQVTPYPGVTVDVRVRALTPAVSGSDADVFFQLHLWN